MTPAEYAKVRDVFARAIQLQAEERDSFLQRECGVDSTIYREVKSLLRHHQDATILSQTGKDTKAATIDVVASSKIDPYLVQGDVWEESRQVLRRRLVIIAVAIAILITLSMFRLATYRDSEWGYGSRLFVIAASFAVAWILHRSRDIGLGSLRLAKWVIVGNAIFLEIVVYVRCVQDAVARDQLANVISLNNWHYFAWTFIVLVYGIFMPNTWRRSAATLIPVAAIPFVVDLVLGYDNPTFTTILQMSAWGRPITAPFVAAGIAICAAQTIHGAKILAFKARRLAQYELVRLIGEGGMGRVYEAQHLLLKRACAVKLIQPERSTEERALKRFQREVRATARLTHPHTIEVYDFGETKDGVFFFAMELLPGMNLRELVKIEGRLPFARAVHFLVEVCDALIEAHQAGMIHRDIKPANIFASQRGGIHDFTKLLDFGVVREIKVDASLSITSKMVAGTPAFMSPEQATSPEKLDPRSDLYSVGAVGYYLVSGRPPFVGKTPMQVMLSVVEETPEPVSVHRPDIPADLEAVIMRALSKDPEQRFQDARGFRDELLRCQCAGAWTADDADRWWSARANGDHLNGDAAGTDSSQDTLVSNDTEV